MEFRYGKILLMPETIVDLPNDIEKLKAIILAQQTQFLEKDNEITK